MSKVLRQLHFETITKPLPDVVRQITNLEREAYGEHGLGTPWTLVPFMRHGLVIVCREGEEIVGVVEAMRDWREPGRAYIFGLCVKADRRGQGVGTKLFGRLLGVLREAGFRSAELTVAADNEVARRIYRDTFTFEETGLLPGEYGDGEDRIRMERSL